MCTKKLISTRMKKYEVDEQINEADTVTSLLTGGYDMGRVENEFRKLPKLEKAIEGHIGPLIYDLKNADKAKMLSNKQAIEVADQARWIRAQKSSRTCSTPV